MDQKYQHQSDEKGASISPTKARGSIRKYLKKSSSSNNNIELLEDFSINQDIQKLKNKNNDNNEEKQDDQMAKSGSKVNVVQPEYVNQQKKVVPRRHSATDSDSDKKEGKSRRKRSSRQIEENTPQIKIGVCAMKKKVECKPMKKILKQMECPEFEIIVFDEETILEKEINKWPKVECLISWYSDGFPLKKAQDYVNLVQPFQINDLKKQELLWDRTLVYKTLSSKNIRQPKYYFLRRKPENVINQYYLKEEQEEKERQQKKKDQISNSNSRNLDDENLSVHSNVQNNGSSSINNNTQNIDVDQVNINLDVKNQLNQDSTNSVNINNNSIRGSVKEEINLLNPEQYFFDLGKVSSLDGHYIHNNVNKKGGSEQQVQQILSNKNAENNNNNGSSKFKQNNNINSNYKQQQGNANIHSNKNNNSNSNSRVNNNMINNNNNGNSKKNALNNNNNLKNVRRNRSLELIRSISANKNKKILNLPYPDKKNKQAQNNKENDPVEEIIEFDDFIMIGHQKLKKPFVEKPFDAENHNINIYYDQADGGGCKKLYRKINNQSSSYYKNINSIRKDGNFIYEEFLPTDGFDIKVYTVGQDYAHAESRRAPALDGKVKRNSLGREVRYPVQLTFDEKAIAKNIVKLFGQSICGFDLLRSNGKSYVCDVNGWSFVKGNDKFNEDCAVVLKQMIFKKFNINPSQPQQLASKMSSVQSEKSTNNGIRTNQYRPQDKSIKPHKEELRSIVAIFRHGDRTPKQKMKMRVKHPLFIQFFLDQCEDLKKKPSKEVKVKNPKQMQKFLDISTQIYREVCEKTTGQNDEQNVRNDSQDFSSNSDFLSSTQSNSTIFQKDKQDQNDYKLEQLVTVLKLHGSFEGFNRKIQIKPIEFDELDVNDENLQGVKINGKQYAKPKKLLIVLKWGGELTHAGEETAIEYGKQFRTAQYPSEKDGLLRLHNTYRHDLKTFTSDEGRCQKTAGHFLQGLLDQEGDVTSVMSTLLSRDTTAQQLLDQSQEGQLELQAKEQLSELFNSERDILEHFTEKFGSEDISKNMLYIMDQIQNPRQKLIQQYELIKQLETALYQRSESNKKTYYITQYDYIKINNEEKCCQDESISLMFKRWRKLKVDFKSSDQIFNISKISDVYDNIKYDFTHNQELLNQIYPQADKLYQLSELLASFIVPHEFGLTIDNKYNMAQEVVGPLCDKIKNDIMWWKQKQYAQDFYKWKKDDISGIQSPWRHVRSRFYFANASHLYSLFNIIYIGLAKKSEIISNEKLDLLMQIKSLQYFSHIVFKLYEDINLDESDENRFRLELSLSSGCAIDSFNKVNKGHKVPIKTLLPINLSLKIGEFIQFFESLEHSKSNPNNIAKQQQQQQQQEQNNNANSANNNSTRSTKKNQQNLLSQSQTMEEDSLK